MTPAHSRSAPPCVLANVRTGAAAGVRQPAGRPGPRATARRHFRHRRHPIPGGHRRFRRGRCPRSRPGRGDPRRPDPHGPVPPDQRRRRRPERRFGHLARRLALEGRRLPGLWQHRARRRRPLRRALPPGRHGQEGSAGRRGVLGTEQELRRVAHQIADRIYEKSPACAACSPPASPTCSSRVRPTNCRLPTPTARIPRSRCARASRSSRPPGRLMVRSWPM